MKEPERWFSVKTALWNAAGVKSTNWVSAFLGGAQIRATQRGPVHALWAVILGRTPRNSKRQHAAATSKNACKVRIHIVESQTGIVYRYGAT